MRLKFVGSALAATLAVGCGTEAHAPNPTPQSAFQQLVAAHSLAVTEEAVLRPFTLQRVLNQLIATSDVRNLDALTLFQQWWDTQNQGPGLGLGPSCDDEVIMGIPSLNGFP